MKLVWTSGIRTLPGDGRPLAALYRDHLEEAVLAEELGFDCVWASEHHFSPDAWNPSPFTFLAAVAARTRRVRLGTFVLLLPLHNPLRVAEDVAVLDNISQGRVDLGVGVGSSPEEFRTFGIPIENRLGRTFEALRVIERCFAGERFSHQGKYYTFPDVHLTTLPVQRPGPPILVAAMGEQSVRWTARRGYGMAAGAGRGHDAYLAGLRANGHDPATRPIASVPLRVHVAATREEAWDAAEAGLHQVLYFYRTHGNPAAGSRGAEPLGALPPVGEFRHVPGIGHGGQPFAVGTPDEVLRALLPYRGRQLTHLSLNLHHPGQDSATVRRSMRLLAEHLMPVLKAW
ncbi:MAG TPA: LLM class flavin-dependent oxidoreductase [Stellaceae bacterium]|jgi:alkanesulfonate monooxygenase SsuD/methylene tetrahydromethanopterin reductase-like flavin-dependent oxidoreductase (luciferase family)|nr:LLM class flavin-dependent oxidoreductase [Stellaceae bacterium]